MTTLARMSLLLVVALMLHTAVAPNLRVAGASADVLLVVTIAAAVVAGAQRGAVVGFVAGVLADCFLQTPFGLSALSYTVVGHAVGALIGRLAVSSPWRSLLAATAGGAAGVMLFAVVGAVLGEPQLLSGRLPTIVAVVGISSGLLVPLARRPVRWALTSSAPAGSAR